MRIAIIGAGMAGLSCADGLTNAGHRVTLYDKGRGPGGRMSTRRIETTAGIASFDHGAQYFTVRNPGFAAQVRVWADNGIAAPWPDAGPDAWVGTPGMNAIVKQMASQHDAHFATLIKGLFLDSSGWWLVGDQHRFGPYDALVLAIPAEQCAPLLSLADFDMARRVHDYRTLPCWTVMLAFDQPVSAGQPIYRHIGDIGWAARNSAKPGRGGPESWVIQATPAWSATHVDDDAASVTETLVRQFAALIGSKLPPPIMAQAHRWRFARASGSNNGAYWGARWNAAKQVGVCGDWLLGPRIENAWLSGQMMARRIMAQTPSTG